MSHPRFQAQNPRFSHDKFGWYACGPVSLAMGIEAVKGDQPRVRGKQVRLRTEDSQPKDGTNLAQLQKAAGTFGVDVEVRRRLPFNQLLAALKAHRPAVVGLSYAPMRHEHTTGDPNFTGNHYVLLIPDKDGIRCFDPLCDGRRPGINLGSYLIGHALLEEATSQMVVDAHGNTVGAGRVYAGLLPPLKSADGGGVAVMDHDPVDDPTPVDPTPLVLRRGGEKRFRGQYLGIHEVSNIRANPHVTQLGAPADNIVGHLRRGESFYCAQTTEIGQKVAGSRRWHGDRSGDHWIHSSRVRHV